jgi:hypothetical protein
MMMIDSIVIKCHKVLETNVHDGLLMNVLTDTVR